MSHSSDQPFAYGAEPVSDPGRSRRDALLQDESILSQLRRYAGVAVRNFADAKASDITLFRKFFHAALERGVYLAPSPFEACFMSAAHSDDDVSTALERMRDALREAIA